jgi:UDP-GlcNAc:undecaprenyl-phosphate GlcNAc-1-phosphate transferase
VYFCKRYNIILSAQSPPNKSKAGEYLQWVCWRLFAGDIMQLAVRGHVAYAIIQLLIGVAMIIWAIIAVIALAMGLSATGTFFSRRLALRLDMLDIPSGHKAHHSPVPLLGGVGIFAAVLLPVVAASLLAIIWNATGPPAWLPETLKQLIPTAASKAPGALGILAGALVLHVVGLLDDKRAMGPWIKLALQFIVAAWVVVFCDVRVLRIAGPTVSSTVSILWLVTITNAFNFLDNMDGLSAGVAAICTAAQLTAAVSLGQLFVAAWLCLLLGALLGFLPFNFSPASSYMGDAGSLVVGFLLGVLSCLTSYVQPDRGFTVYRVLAPLVVMAVPLYDVVSVIVLRLRAGQNPASGDRRHFSHRLLRRGMGVRGAVLTIYLCTAATAIAASLLPHVSTWAPAILIFVQTGIIIMVIALLESAKR